MTRAMIRAANQLSLYVPAVRGDYLAVVRWVIVA
jgi:hypothetical protein